jgi:hypothetical protein
VQAGEGCESLAEEWRRLCSWLRGKADQAIAATNDEAAKRSIQMQVTRFCRDVPPTKALLSAWQMLFNDAVASWETRRANDELLDRLSEAPYLNSSTRNRQWRHAA